MTLTIWLCIVIAAETGVIVALALTLRRWVTMVDILRGEPLQLRPITRDAARCWRFPEAVQRRDWRETL